MKRAALVLHADRPEADAAGKRLAAALAAAGVEPFALEGDAARLGEPVRPLTHEEMEQGFDIMVSLGGDGTLLRAAELATVSGTPLLGVNLGRLGFLAALEPDDLDTAVDRLVGGGFETSERMTLEAEVPVAGRVWALNDIGVSKVNPGRTVKLGVTIAGEPFTVFAADGLIVASPTGSTAYSFSARGPVVTPAIDCLVLTPVSPHQAFDRSIVAAGDETIEIEVLAGSDSAALSADGRQPLTLAPGATVTVRRSDRRLRLAHVDGGPFWRLVRKKFRLAPDA